MVEYLVEHAEDIRGKQIVELGAGIGLPSVVASMKGAKRVVITDYPDEDLLMTIKSNVERLDLKNMEVVGHKWGSNTQQLRDLSCGRGFDLIIISDAIFNHYAHNALLRSCSELLCDSPESRILVSFSHHRPRLYKEDLNFFEVHLLRS
mmetsp:Transcript_41221/g.129515  ORF Transcript_41221/g.129515 Transcript_41221/m.129515 type:complete len:149 (-) Transcript_41221:381-827(-)